MNPKIDDVAKLAGVSAPTVSRVLNKTKYVSPDLEKRVLDAIKELDYIPNYHAKALASNTSNVIGLIIPKFDDINLSYFLNSCSRIFDQHNLDLMISKTGNDSNKEIELIDIQLSSKVSGIIIVTPFINNKLMHILREINIPIIFIYNEDQTSSFHSIIFDNYNAAKTLIKKNKNLHKNEFIILSSSLEEISVKNRINGFKSAFKELGIDKYNIIEIGSTIESGYKKCIEILDKKHKSTVVCTNDYLAIGALRAAYEKKIKIPEEIEISGFSSTKYSEICTPLLTTIKFNNNIMGEKAAETMIRLIDNQNCKKIQILDFEIIKGESCILI